VEVASCSEEEYFDKQVGKCLTEGGGRIREALELAKETQCERGYYLDPDTEECRL